MRYKGAAVVSQDDRRAAVVSCVFLAALPALSSWAACRGWCAEYGRLEPHGDASGMGAWRILGSGSKDRHGPLRFRAAAQQRFRADERRGHTLPLGGTAIIPYPLPVCLDTERGHLLACRRAATGKRIALWPVQGRRTLMTAARLSEMSLCLLHRNGGHPRGAPWQSSPVHCLLRAQHTAAATPLGAEVQ